MLHMNRSNAIRAAHMKAANAAGEPTRRNEPFNMNDPAAALKKKLKKELKKTMKSQAESSLKEKVSYYQNTIWDGKMPYDIQEQLLNDPDMEEILQHLTY